MNEIEHTLSHLFEKHRIIFWYDVKQELRDEYEAVTLPDVVKIRIENNQFGVKVRILHQEPTQKFLLYHEGPPPPDPLDNWLLDIELAYGQFKADQTALWLTELGLGLEFTDVVEPHADFFRSTRRRQSLKALLTNHDTPSQIRLKMTAVCAAADPHLNSILENLLAELADKKEEKIRLIERCQLTDFLWTQLERQFNYHSQTPGLHDFTLQLFKSSYQLGLRETAVLNNDAHIFLTRWQDSVRHRQAFAILSAACATDLNIKQDLDGRDYRSLAELDSFELIEQKVLFDLIHDVTKRTIKPEAVRELLRQRRRSYWYTNYQPIYEAIGHATTFMETLQQASLTMHSLSNGVAQ